MPDLDFLDGQAPGSDAAPVDQADTTAAPARAADGKFASVHADAAPVEEPAPVDGAKPEPGHVPVTALLDERDKRQNAERELERLRQQQAPATAAEHADVDPDTVNLVMQTRLNISEDLARDKYGDELVDKAKAAIIAKFAENPSFQQEILATRNPYRATVEWFQAQQRLEAVKDPTEFEAFQAWKAAQAAGQAHPAQAQSATAAPKPAAPAAPPRSIASAANAGGQVDTAPQGPGVAFDTVIK